MLTLALAYPETAWTVLHITGRVLAVWLCFSIAAFPLVLRLLTAGRDEDGEDLDCG